MGLTRLANDCAVLRRRSHRRQSADRGGRPGMLGLPCRHWIPGDSASPRARPGSLRLRLIVAADYAKTREAVRASDRRVPGLRSCWRRWRRRSTPARATLCAWRPASGMPAGRSARDAAVAKMIASDVAMKVTTDAVQVLGGYGYSTGTTRPNATCGRPRRLRSSRERIRSSGSVIGRQLLK